MTDRIRRLRQPVAQMRTEWVYIFVRAAKTIIILYYTRPPSTINKHCSILLLVHLQSMINYVHCGLENDYNITHETRVFAIGKHTYRTTPVATPTDRTCDQRKRRSAVVRFPDAKAPAAPYVCARAGGLPIWRRNRPLKGRRLYCIRNV